MLQSEAECIERRLRVLVLAALLAALCWVCGLGAALLWWMMRYG